MKISDAVFWFCSFFLIGILWASIISSYALIFVCCIVGLVYFLSQKQFKAILFIGAILIGCTYYQSWNSLHQPDKNLFGAQQVSGIVTSVLASDSGQQATVYLNEKNSVRIKATMPRYPELRYGDEVQLEGVIEEPLSGIKEYYAKDGIVGIMRFPKVVLKSRNHGNPVMRMLNIWKQHITSTFQSFLPADQAAFLSGLTLGDRANFSQELKDQFARSGTTHLVALSGYNITVIAWAASIFFGLFVRRQWVFYCSVAVIILFVCMAGGQASVVRAAIMGLLVLAADKLERHYSIRNAIILSAFIMVLFNPKVLAFDLGFQLSFAALCGIIYIAPALKHFFRFRDDTLVSLKENVVMTLGAQLAVVPFLLGSFGIFSLTGFLANLLVAGAIPMTMGLGFIMAAAGFISGYAAQIIGWIAHIFLSYELFVIKFFSIVGIIITVPSLSFICVIGYYGLLIWFTRRFYAA